MKHEGIAIQHFNAACRAARSMPNLGISRLLMSLNDGDLDEIHPIVQSTLKLTDMRSYVAAGIFLFMRFIAIFPSIVGNSILYFIITLSTNATLFALALLFRKHVSAATVVYPVVAFVFGFKVYLQLRKFDQSRRDLQEVSLHDDVLEFVEEESGK
jgi:hypothetical protein